MRYLLLFAALPLYAVTPPAVLPQNVKDLSAPMQIIILMTALTLLPAIIMSITPFLRISIVLHFLRQALGTQSAPSNQVLVGLALFLTFFVMSPVLDRAYNDAYKPFSDGSITMDQAMTRGVAPFKQFMLRQTREADLALFARIAKAPPMNGPEDVPLSLLVPSFVTSEL